MHDDYAIDYWDEPLGAVCSARARASVDDVCGLLVSQSVSRMRSARARAHPAT